MDVNQKVAEARAHHDKALEIMGDPTVERWGVYLAQCHNQSGILDLLDVIQWLLRVPQGLRPPDPDD